MNQAVETQAVETQEATKTITVSIGLYNALEALAPGWQIAWTPQQVELARNIYALGMRDAQIFANKSLENVMEGYQSAVINLKEGSDWLIGDLDKPAVIQAAMAAETAKQAAADAAASTGTVDLGAVEEPAAEVEVPAEHASDLDVEEQEYQERMNNAVQAEVDARNEEAGRDEETDHRSEAPVPDAPQPVSEAVVQAEPAAETAPAEVVHQPV